MKNYVKNFKPYSPTTHDIWKLDKKIYKESLKLDWNEATIQPSPYVKEKIKSLAAEGDFFNLYPNTNNTKLLKLLADYVGVNIKNVQIFPSSDVAHECISRIWIGRGDETGILWPTYDNYRATIELTGAHISYCEMKNLSFDKKQLNVYLENYNPDLFYICNPNNPSGEQIEIEDIEDVVSSNLKTMFVIDEAYAEFSGISSCKLIEKYTNLIICRTFSKAFGLANFRIGFLVSNADNIQMLSRVRNAKNISTFAQEAAIAAIEDKESMFNYVEEVRNARIYFINELRKIDYINRVYLSSTNFVLIELRNNIIKDTLMCFLRKQNIFIRDLFQNEYLKNYCVRITIGTKQQMETVIKQMRSFTL